MHTFLKSNKPINASSTSRLSGFEIKSPSIRLSIRVQVLRNSAKLCGRGTFGSAYITLFSSNNARPDFELVLKRATPAETRFFVDFLSNKPCAGGRS